MPSSLFGTSPQTAAAVPMTPSSPATETATPTGSNAFQMPAGFGGQDLRFRASVAQGDQQEQDQHLGKNLRNIQFGLL